MNAYKTHYVANADAKVQLFFLMTITLWHFFTKEAFRPHTNCSIFKQLDTKSLQTAIFSLFLCNFAVACDCSPRHSALHRELKQKETHKIYAEYS